MELPIGLPTTNAGVFNERHSVNAASTCSTWADFGEEFENNTEISSWENGSRMSDCWVGFKSVRVQTDWLELFTSTRALQDKTIESVSASCPVSAICLCCVMFVCGIGSGQEIATGFDPAHPSGGLRSEAFQGDPRFPCLSSYSSPVYSFQLFQYTLR